MGSGTTPPARPFVLRPTLPFLFATDLYPPSGGSPPPPPQGSARVIRCLTDQRNKLSTTCRAVLFDEEVRFSQNLDFQYPMRQV